MILIIVCGGGLFEGALVTNLKFCNRDSFEGSFLKAQLSVTSAAFACTPFEYSMLRR